MVRRVKEEVPILNLVQSASKEESVGRGILVRLKKER